MLFESPVLKRSHTNLYAERGLETLFMTLLNCGNIHSTVRNIIFSFLLSEIYNKHVPTVSTLMNLSSACAILKAHNLMFPLWFMIPCDKRLRVDVLCWESSHKMGLSINNNQTKTFQCHPMYFVFLHHCLLLSMTFSKHQKYFFLSQELKLILMYASKVSQSKIEFLLHSKFHTDVLHITFNKARSQMEETKSTEQTDYVFHVYQEEFLHSTNIPKDLQLQVLRCSKDEYISILWLYQETSACHTQYNLSDTVCFINSSSASFSQCKACLPPNCHCSNLHYRNKNGFCVLYRVQLSSNNSGTFVSHMNPISYLSDCSNNELNLIKLTGMFAISTCDVENTIPCTYGCKQCFPISKLCAFELSHNGHLLFCPSGAHLKNCEELKCNNMMKCLSHYCIPYR